MVIVGLSKKPKRKRRKRNSKRRKNTADGPIEWRKVCQGRREVVTIGNCLLRELPPSPTHFGDQMHDVKTTVDEENFKGIPRDFSAF